MLLDTAERNRREVAVGLEPKTKAQLGQYMTPARMASYMASMFPPSALRHCRLLDAGAGLGALTCAFLDRWEAGGFGFADVHATAHEFDARLRGHLQSTLAAYGDTKRLDVQVHSGDFIVDTVLALLESRAGRPYTHAILNPPYKKINNNSEHRRALRQVGIETVNLYSAFVALAIELMAPGGLLVAIIPRSFCNGPYYQDFREGLFKKTALRTLHLFDRRDSAFKDDDVLQENIIVMLERDGQQGDVQVSTSSDDSFADLEHHQHPFDRVVFPGDAECFIHVPTSLRATELETALHINSNLDQLGLKLSTGPVVDFRLKSHLRAEPEAESAPLVYPAHLAANHGVSWPLSGGKKPNAIMVNDHTRPWLIPRGFYCVVRRFSSKEEKRRIVANVVRPDDFAVHGDYLGLENHLNVFNNQRRGLDELLAYGIAAYMNTTAVDEAFRRFSGHTQVNAADLRKLPYPRKAQLLELGGWFKGHMHAQQEELDMRFRSLTQ
jgi:adenine-specific DNA-methyltransferase